MSTKVIIAIVVGILLAITVYFAYIYYINISAPTSRVTSAQNVGDAVKEQVIPNSPTPMPFQELTIPYLRSKTYESSLGELEQAFTGSNYTAYLTSYTSDGLRINGLLTRPTGDEPEGGWPAVVFVHGYIPPAQYATLERYGDYVDFLARNGFVVFKIDLRGHGDSEGEPGGAYYSADYAVDTLNAYAALQASGFVNPSKIGLWGHSMAGNVLSRALAAKPDIPAVVIWAGAGFTYKDLADYMISDSSFQPNQISTTNMSRRQRIRDLYGQPDLTKEFWKQMTMVSYLDDITGAIAIHHAVNDDVVSVEYARNLKTYLESSDVEHEVFEYPSGGHNITGAAFGTAMQRTVEFYNRNL